MAKRALDLITDRLYSLTPSEQFELYEQLRAHLGSDVVEVDADKKVRERAEALEIIGKVAQHLGLSDGHAPTSTQFKKAVGKVAPGWNISRVARAWRRWRFACDAYLGKSITPQARPPRRAGRSITTEEAYASLKQWLSTSPKSETREAYEKWAAKHNQVLQDGELPAPGNQNIRGQTGLSWRGSVSVAKGEETEQTAAKPKARSKDYNTGPHDLIAALAVREILAKNGKPATTNATRAHDFPTPVIVKREWRLWFREDIVNFATDQPVQPRTENELGDLYLDPDETAALLGAPISSIRRGKPTRLIPAATLRIGKLKLWSRAEAEEQLARWRRSQAGTGQPAE